jgi:pyridoxal phosphate enzyme (YggS family)
MLLEAYKSGQRHFGENYVQELVDKEAQLPKDIHWHFIGHLQSNKVKYIAPFVYLIHGVDSFSLLKEINKQAQKNNRVIDCLLQIYIAQEETKFGLDFNEASDILNSVEFKELKNIQIKGFMAMASNTEKEEQIRKEFKSLKEFSKQFPDYSIPKFWNERRLFISYRRRLNHDKSWQ